MPSGDMLPTTGDTYAMQLGDILLAGAERHPLAPFWITKLDGFGDLNPDPQDMPYSSVDGTKRTLDRQGDQIIVATCMCGTGDAISMEAAYWPIRTEWMAHRTADTDLYLYVPHLGRCRVVGRPRPLKRDILNANDGVMQIVASFTADPEVHLL